MSMLERYRGERIAETVYDEPRNEGPGFDLIPARVLPEKRPSLDDFVLVDRADRDNVLHIARVGSGHEINPESDPQLQQESEAYGLPTDDVRSGDHAPRVTRVVDLEPAGELVVIEGDEDDEPEIDVRRPTLLPQTAQPVYALSGTHLPELLGLPGEDDPPGFEIGTVESGGEEAPFEFSREVVSRHVAILGRTGVGKTHTAHVLVEELVEQGVPVVSFDVEDDAAPMADALDGTTVRPDEDLEIPYSLIGYEGFEKFLSDLTDTQKELVATGYSTVHEQAVQQLEEEGEVDISFGELLSEVENYGDNIGSQATDAAVSRTGWALNSTALLGEEMDDWGELLTENSLVNVDIGHLGQRDRALVIGAISRMLKQLRARDEIPPFVLVVDEAHKYIPSGTSKTASTRIVRDLVQTGRHVGIGAVLATQSPSSLDQITLRTCNTHVVLALDSEEMSSVRGLFGDLSRDTIDRIPKLEKGRAMVASARDLIRNTVPVEVRDRWTPEGSPTPDLVADAEAWFDEHSDDDRDFQGSLDQSFD